MIERPGSYHRIGTIVEYQRLGMLEKIFIAGPISKDIKVMVMYQNRDFFERNKQEMLKLGICVSGRRMRDNAWTK